MSTDTLLSTDEIAAAAGITFRQLDYWSRHGIVHPVVECDGSGTYRRWSSGQIPMLIVLGRVSDALADRWSGRVGRSGASKQILSRVAANWADGSLALSEHVTLRWQVPAVQREGSAA